ncbi:MAG: hypothetical protein LBJ88_02700 [Campylobacteraceae bacterium]|nr:hypothetical protein [Campylobacteraceae bacterium]
MSNQRDYDKNPIIIKDYNYIFTPLFICCLIPFAVYAFLYNPGELSATSLAINTFMIFSLSILPALSIYRKARNKRTILLLNKSIQFSHADKIVEEIYLNDIADIKRTYSDIYHKSQELTGFQKVFVHTLSFLMPIVWHMPLITLKFFFHFFKKGSQYHLFDAIIVFSSDNFINILPTTKKEYEDVRKYFMLKKPVFDIKYANVFWNFESHLIEEKIKEPLR